MDINKCESILESLGDDQRVSIEFRTNLDRAAGTPSIILGKESFASFLKDCRDGTRQILSIKPQELGQASSFGY